MSTLYGSQTPGTGNPSEFKHAEPNCPGRLILDSGEVVCTMCGASRPSEAFDDNWGTPAIRQSRSHPMHLGTAQPRGVTSFVSSASMQSSKSTREWTLDEIVDSLGRSLSLPTNVRYSAALLGRKVLSSRASARTSLRYVGIYSIIQACRAAGIQRSLREVLEAARVQVGVSPADAFRALNKIAGSVPMSYRSASASDYIRLIVRRLGESYKDEIYLRAIFRRAGDIFNSLGSDWDGKNPLRVAACCIYAADLEMGFKLGLGLLCSVTHLTADVLRGYIDEMDHNREARKSWTDDTQSLLELEARSFKVSLRRPR